MKCSKCQAENREEVKFCEDCGAKMEVKCPSCGAFIAMGKRFCGDCGHNLRKPKEAPSVNYSEPQSYTPMKGSSLLIALIVSNVTIIKDRISRWLVSGNDALSAICKEV